MPYAVRQIMRWKDDIGSKVAMKANTQNPSRAMNKAIPVKRRSVFMARWLAHWKPFLVIDKSKPRITCLNGAISTGRARKMLDESIAWCPLEIPWAYDQRRA